MMFLGILDSPPAVFSQQMSRLFSYGSANEENPPMGRPLSLAIDVFHDYILCLEVAKGHRVN